MKSYINFQIIVFFIIAFSMVTTVSYLYFKSTEEFTHAANQVRINQQIINQLEIVISLLKDVETGERGFIITRQENFLEPFNAAKGQLSSEIPRLENLISDRKDLQKSFAAVKPLINKVIGIYQSNVNDVRSGQYELAQSSVESGEGKAVLDSIREAIAGLITAEEHVLARLEAEVEKKAQNNFLINLLSVGITLLLLVIGMITILNNLRQQQRLQKEIQLVNNNLSATNEELNAAVEELQTTNEELNTSNEKLYESNEKLRELHEQVVQANKELESFSYSISHDLRTPLRSVIGFSNILLETCRNQLDEEGKRLLSIISKNALTMGEMVDGLLDFARIGKKAVIKGKVSMDKLIAPILEEQQNMHNADKQVQIELKTLPQVMADLQLMKLVWANLLSNAFKFTAKTDKPFIKIDYQDKNDEFVFCVQDNGVGFDMQYADKLFGVFNRLHTQEEFEGNGVGLAIVQRVVAGHGGRVWATAAPGKGATFYFTLPK